MSNLSVTIKKLSRDFEQYVIDMRREFHTYPEISNQEERTSARIQEELTKMDIPFEVLPDRSVIGIIKGEGKGSENGKTLAVRADIDALKIQEETDLPWKSKNDGVMHACGHDAHAAMLLGVAKILKELKGNFRGTVKTVFHVAEETGGGYQEILNYFERTGGVDRIIATHVWAGLDAGTIAIDHGARMAGAQAFAIEVTGRGGHASRPDQAVSPIFPLCDIVMKLPYIPQYFHNALETSVVSVGQVVAGTNNNTIPDTAQARGGMRFFVPETREILMGYMRRLVENIAKAYGAEGKVDFVGGIGPVINDADSVELGRKVASGIEGLKVVSFEPICASDCYGMLLRKYPGFYCFLGIRNEAKGAIYGQHHAKYDIDEDVMKLNCEFLSKYAIEYLDTKE